MPRAILCTLHAPGALINVGIRFLFFESANWRLGELLEA